MNRLFRFSCILLIGFSGQAAAAELWTLDAGTEASSALVGVKPATPQTPALLRYRSAVADAPSPFARAADTPALLASPIVATPEPQPPAQIAAAMSAPAEGKPAEAATALAAPPPAPHSSATVPQPSAPGPGVLDAVAFETALAAKLTASPPAPNLRPVWAAVAEVYRANFNRPIWRSGGHWSPAAQGALARLARARDDALALPAGAPTTLLEGDPDAIATQDLALTAAVVSYARQAAGDRIDPTRISKLITARPVLPEPREIVDAVAAAGDHASDVLSAFNPPHAGYRALREKLAELRKADGPMATRIPAGAPLKIGMRDPRVPLIRTRFGLEITAPQSPDDVLYDTRVAEAVAGFQRERGLAPTGVLTPRTVALLSGGEPRRLENEIVANMERWRWLPRDLGADRIEVDIPNFSLALVRDGKIVHRARVIVGKPQSATPVFSNAMKSIIVNPSWYIPPSILKNEILPKLAGDPGYLARLGYEMTVRRGQVSIRQPPGERNALGRIKFMFPNEHSVYLHDTPSRGLFASPRRALSHGCVRVDDPFALAAAVLNGAWSESRIKALVGRGERTINLPAPLPIHLEYFTATIGPDGRLQFRDDLYGYDRAVMRALALVD